ncbi:MAG TPA: hypothetical protein VE175_14745 [Woeseiaceae bacterium]|nr:hypothetical protein [Woeseiaceae bacterium]
MLRKRHRGWQTLAACFLLACLPARADVTRTDVQVAARALSFVSNPLAGRIDVGIVYSAASPRSVTQAKDLRSMLDHGLRIGALDLQPVLVELNDVPDADVDLFFLTEHIAPDETPPLVGIAGTPIICVTTDIEQVRNGVCTIGVRSRPRVEVFVSRAAAMASDVTFATAFRVMITEL